MLELNKAECEHIIGHTIRNDTYFVMQALAEGKDYDDVYKYIEQNKELLGMKERMGIVKKETCITYLEKVGNITPKEEVKTIKPVKNNNQEIGKNRGVYGIYIDDELVYIGQTNRSFKQRFQEHRRLMNDISNGETIYRLLRMAKRQNKNITLVPLISVDELNIDKRMKINDRDIKMMELALIYLYQPKGNVKGRSQPYTL